MKRDIDEDKELRLFFFVVVFLAGMVSTIIFQVIFEATSDNTDFDERVKEINERINYRTEMKETCKTYAINEHSFNEELNPDCFYLDNQCSCYQFSDFKCVSFKATENTLVCTDYEKIGETRSLDFIIK